jgi:methionyl aminopeptidase
MLNKQISNKQISNKQISNKQISNEQQYTIKDYMQWSSEIHDLIEEELREICRPGISLINIVMHIENRIDELTSSYAIVKKLAHDLPKGKAFPVGINVNNVAAHWSPLIESDTDTETNVKTNGGANYIIQITDVVTIDYGIHFDGYILDAAFTFAYDEMHRKLLECGLEACKSTVNLIKPNQQIYILSKNIVKVAKKYNYTLIKDLCGHQITQYKIHNGIIIPNCNMNLKKSLRSEMIFTIEPFISTSNGNIKYGDDITHYMFNYHVFDYDKLLFQGKIPDFLVEYKTLAFNRRHILDLTKLPILDDLVKQQIYLPYAPIIEIDTNAYVCQFETTVYIDSSHNVISYKNHKDIDDYLLIS